MEFELRGRRPKVHPDAYIAPTAVLIGDVEIAAGASVWFGAVLRGDEATIKVGEGANIQDNAVNHCAALPGSRGQVPSGSEADPRLIFALPARAKLNLNLEVLGRSADGFHDLRTTFQAVALHDLLEVEPAKETTFTTSGLRVSAETNSVLVAQQAMESAAKRPLPARIHLDN